MKLSIITVTHDPKWILQTWASVQMQTHGDFEWVVMACDNEGRSEVVDAFVSTIKGIVGDDPRVRISADKTKFRGIGARKNAAFMKGEGEALIELDHDDLLAPNALEEIAKAFEDATVGFVYSDFADFEEGSIGQGAPTYRHPNVRAGWISNGFTFYNKLVEGVRPGVYECVNSFPPSAASVSLVYWAPNHVRCWRRQVYRDLGGHDPVYPVADDHELLLRTYCATKMHHIPQPLYLYRVGDNTWSKRVEEIKTLSYKARSEQLENIILRDCALAGLPAYDLGAAFNRRAGWKTVDIEGEVDVRADLDKKWPWKDNSVGAFRAADLLEHLEDKQHAMREIHRCLRPGGWLVSFTPSTDGRGAWMDPTHVSGWNELSFWYWTRRAQADYIRNRDIRFQEHVLETIFPSDWHRQHNIPYVSAILVALKPGYEGPGEKTI